MVVLSDASGDNPHGLFRGHVHMSGHTNILYLMDGTHLSIGNEQPSRELTIHLKWQGGVKPADMISCMRLPFCQNQDGQSAGGGGGGWYIVNG